MNVKDNPNVVSIEVAERQLDRVQGFFPRIDNKVSALFAIASAQIATVGLNLTFGDLKTWYITLPLALFVAAVGWTILSLYYCTYPHLSGGRKSLVYFNEIASLTEAEYDQRYTALSEVELKRDIVGQIWRNSEIVKMKYWYLKNATVASMLGVMPWSIILIATSLNHARMPVIQ